MSIEVSRQLRSCRRMKNDLYTKVVLTIIAACLIGLLFRDVPVVTTARAESGNSPSDPLWVSIAGTAQPIQITNRPNTQGNPIPLLVQQVR
jgi:hypothetical protein